MTAYIVFIRDEMTDLAEYETYVAKATASPPQHDITPLAMYGAHETLEGLPTEGVVLMSYPTMEEARAWYHSPEYQDAVKHRFAAARYRVILFEGIG